MPGMRTSISTTSGRCRRTSRTASSPSRGLGDDGDVAGRLQDHAQPGAHQRLVVDDQHPDHRRARRTGGSAGMRAHREAAVQPRAAPATCRRAGRPARAARPGPSPLPGTGPGRPRPAAVLHRDLSPSRPWRSVTVGGRPPACLTTLVSASCTTPVAVRCAAAAAAAAAPRRRGDRQAGGPRCSSSRSRSASVGCGASIGAVLGPRAARPSTWRSSGIASRPVVRIRAACLGGARVGGVDLQRPGVQHHQRDPVRDHVVHLPGDAGPLLGPGLLGARVLLAFEPLGPVAQLPTSARRARPTARSERQPDGQHRHHDGEQGGHRPMTAGHPDAGRRTGGAPDQRHATRNAARPPAAGGPRRVVGGDHRGHHGEHPATAQARRRTAASAAGAGPPARPPASPARPERQAGRRRGLAGARNRAAARVGGEDEHHHSQREVTAAGEPAQPPRWVTAPTPAPVAGTPRSHRPRPRRLRTRPSAGRRTTERRSCNLSMARRLLIPMHSRGGTELTDMTTTSTPR